MGRQCGPVVPGFCSAVAGWILQGTAVHKNVSQASILCAVVAVVQQPARGPRAQGDDCADSSTKCNISVPLLQSTLTESNLFCTSTRIREESAVFSVFYVLGLFYFELVT